MSKDLVKKHKIYSKATDPIYIGTGGFNIGRVDNTIVRDPITKIPKIPGSSLAGTWRYFMALELQSKFKDDYRIDRRQRNGKNNEDLYKQNTNQEWVKDFEGNKYAAIKCAGQDDNSSENIDENYENTGHCGNCIVCKSFGYSKKNRSEQGQLSFSDLNILFFPVYTREGVRWITSNQILKDAGLTDMKNREDKINVSVCSENDSGNDSINLGWIELPLKKESFEIKKESNFPKENEIIIVPDNLISQIINSNLEVRTSVSIDPITGAAKEGALFTSEAIPRATYFYGEIRIMDKNNINIDIDKKIKYPNIEHIESALIDTKKYYLSLGIGGMTTRGFGRMEVFKIGISEESGK